MFNKINVTRIVRYIDIDSSLPTKCYSRWFYMDVTEKCDCDKICKYKNFTKQDFIDYADKCYNDLKIKKMDTIR